VAGEVLVFGGTFDPVHNGHIAIAEQALEQIAAGSVWFVPARVPALREHPVASVEDRVDMLAAALQHQHGLVLRTDEVERAGASYTVDTMRALHGAYPHTEFLVLIGADAARTMPRWERAAELLAGDDFLIVNRSGTPRLDEHEAAWLGFDTRGSRLITVDSPDISASEVRRRVAAGLPIDGLVPEPVAALIRDRGLYLARAAGA